MYVFRCYGFSPCARGHLAPLTTISVCSVKNETSLGALGKSATTMGSTMLMFGSVAFTYAACEAALESFRGEADWKNGAMAGFAAGVVCFWHYTPTILCQPNHRRLVSHAVGYSHSLVLNSSLQDLLSAFAMEALDQQQQLE